MTKTRTRTLKLTLADNFVLRTADDVAYAWVTHGRHTGWSRTTAPHQHNQDPVLLVPKNLDRAKATALLDLTPEDLQAAPTYGSVLLPAGTDATPAVQRLQALRAARKQGKTLPLNDVTLSRATPEEVLELTRTEDTGAAARALDLASLPAREQLVETLGHDLVTKVLTDHPEMTTEAVQQIKRSAGYRPTVETHGDLPELAGNPNLDVGAQIHLVKSSATQLTTGNPEAETTLRRALACPTLPEEAAAWLVGQYETLPRTLARILATNEGATWNWLRELLDTDPHPEVALASRHVGPLTATRLALLETHPDPVVRASVDQAPTRAQWSWINWDHMTTLEAIDDPFSYMAWTLEPDWVEPEDWGAYAVSRQWAARAEELPEAEKALRRAVNLHNRSRGAAGRGFGDPERAARADADQVLAMTDPDLRILDLAPGQTYTIDEARMRAVQAVAALSMEDLQNSESPLVEAILEACAAEAQLR